MDHRAVYTSLIKLFERVFNRNQMQYEDNLRRQLDTQRKFKVIYTEQADLNSKEVELKTSLIYDIKEEVSCY